MWVEFDSVEIEIRMIEAIEDESFDDFFKCWNQVNGGAGGWGVAGQIDSDFEAVVVAMPIGIVALAKACTVLLFIPAGHMQPMGSCKVKTKTKLSACRRGGA